MQVRTSPSLSTVDFLLPLILNPPRFAGGFFCRGVVAICRHAFWCSSFDDMVVQVGTAAVSCVTSLSLNASKNFTLTING